MFKLVPLPDLRGISPLFKRLKDVCHLPSLWKHFNFNVIYNKSCFDHVFEHAGCFRSLHFTGDMRQLSMEVTMNYIEDALSRCTQLLDLDISYNLSIRNLSFIFQMPKLQILNMEYCCNVDAVTAVLGLKQLQNPKKVILSLCEQFSADQLCNTTQ